MAFVDLAFQITWIKEPLKRLWLVIFSNNSRELGKEIDVAQIEKIKECRVGVDFQFLEKCVSMMKKLSLQFLWKLNINFISWLSLTLWNIPLSPAANSYQKKLSSWIEMRHQNMILWMKYKRMLEIWRIVSV